ncbi:calpain-like protein fragment, putative [Trypanosoma brucei gambiense DAL972]|uniref:Calpain-like protein, putative n=2 Tax=Trypanosoma brucei TaxID=5691 RepID=C9ZIF2_TRYB9|nr:calpain-like protein fragment, putative [Trypanosoma brucei gambiense DAL972]RHW74401.1 calpain-like protein [Trypanosoma brucei equiperdum]CBH08944.1 calpain-like protein fragment, putative [Trypanosoma brucei gambiense DAL972]
MGCIQSTVSYKNGQPNFKGATEVHSMFNGLLFRLSDTKNKRWAFYNDSPCYTIHVAILFDFDTQILPLGSTTAFRIDEPRPGREGDRGKYLAEVDVPPLSTELFVEGEITQWNVDTLEARTAGSEEQYRL